MSAVAGKRRELFEQAPPSALQHRAGLIKHDELNVGRRAFLAVLIGWVPIVMLTVGAAVVQGTEGIWRLVLWTRLLWRISCLDLQLVASHPDHTAGLGFFGHSVRAFSFVAFALTAIAAGRSAQSCWKAAGFRLRSCSSMLDCWASFSSCSPHR